MQCLRKSRTDNKENPIYSSGNMFFFLGHAFSKFRKLKAVNEHNKYKRKQGVGKVVVKHNRVFIQNLVCLSRLI